MTPLSHAVPRTFVFSFSFFYECFECVAVKYARNAISHAFSNATAVHAHAHAPRSHVHMFKRECFMQIATRPVCDTWRVLWRSLVNERLLFDCQNEELTLHFWKDKNPSNQNLQFRTRKDPHCTIISFFIAIYSIRISEFKTHDGIRNVILFMMLFYKRDDTKLTLVTFSWGSSTSSETVQKGLVRQDPSTIGDRDGLRIPQHLVRKSLRLVYMVRRFYDRTFMTTP